MIARLQEPVRTRLVRASWVFMLIAAFATCVADSARVAGASKQAVTLAHKVELRPGVSMTPRQYDQYRRLYEQGGRATASASQAYAAPVDSTLLYPSRYIDDSWDIQSMTVAELNGDGRADIVAFGDRPPPNQIDSRIAVYHQTGDGEAAAPIYSNVNSQVPGRPTGMLVIPILRARPDLLIYGHRWIEIYQLALGGTAPAEPLRITPGTVIQDVAVKDVNSDGRPDLVVTGHDYDVPGNPLKVQRFQQASDGTFTETAQATVPFTPYGIDGTLADIDSDGILDVVNGVSANEGFGFSYRLGRPDGSLGPLITEIESPAQSFTTVRRIAVIDVDADGLMDVIESTGDGARVRYQVSPANFSDGVPLPTSAPVTNIGHVSIGDLDGNGLGDAILWLDGYQRMQVDLQTAPRTFAAFAQYGVPSAGYPSFYPDTTGIADINGDGAADVLAVSSGLQVMYNARGSYPTFDASLTTSVQVVDGGSVAHLHWQHTVANAGPALIDEGLLLQELPVGFEFRGANVACAYFVRLVACAVPTLASGQSAQLTLAAESVARRVDGRNVTSLAVVAPGGRPIDINPANDSTRAMVFVQAHPEGLQTIADEVFVYERAGETIIPVVNSGPETGLVRFMSYLLSGSNAADDTGIAGALNGSIFTAPGQEGLARIMITTRDGPSANGPLHFTVQFSDGGFSSVGGSRLTIVDDDGADPRLTSSGAKPFEQWPALFSSVTTLFRDATPTTVTIGDLDGDGRNDVAVAISDVLTSIPSVRVWLQRPDGSLTNTPFQWTAPFSRAIASLAIGDIVGDGQPELVVPLGDQFWVLRLANGQLQPVDSAQVLAWKVALSDLNLDGRQDLIVADNRLQSFDGPEYWTPNVSVLYGNPQRTLDPDPYRFAMPYAGRNNLLVGHFNSDTRPDIAISSGQGNFPTVSIAYQRTDGTFAAPVGIWVAGPQHLDGYGFGDSLASGDFNGDGRADLAIGSLVDLDAPSVWVVSDLRNDDYASTSQRLYPGPEGNLAAIDINQDGYDDLLADVAVLPGYPGSPMQAYLQDVTGRLRPAGSLPTFGAGQHTNWMQTIAVGDIDGDGEPDAVVLQGDGGRAGQVLHSRAHNQTVQFSSLEAGTVAAGGRARYRIRVTNSGTRDSLEIPLSWTVPSELGSTQIVAAKGACYLANAKAQCLLPQLAPGGYVDVMLTGVFSASGEYPMTITAGPNGTYGQVMLTATVSSGSDGGSGGGGTGGGGTGGGGSGGGGSGGGGGALDLVTLLLLASATFVAQRRLRDVGRSALRSHGGQRRHQ